MATQLADQSRTTRRRFLYLSGLAVTGLVATACGGDDAASTPPAAVPAAQPTMPAAAQQAAGAQATTAAAKPATGAGPAVQVTQAPLQAPKLYDQAPQLAQLVKEGKLPPLEQRLPQNPMVITPLERVGKYGGTWRMGLLGGQDTALLVRTIDYEHLLRWDPEWNQIIPNVAESFEASEDAKTFTFKLRDGMKWSDGQSYTADDLTFYVEDISKNKELTANRGENPPDIQKIDQYTVKITFQQPNGLYLQRNCTPAGDEWTRYPAHYLKKFHAKYQDKETLQRLISEANAKDWVELFRLKGMGIPGTPYDARWQNPELPTVNAWRITEPYGGNAQRVVAERNPFYWKVDTEGNQLPYIDRATFMVAQDKETLVLKGVNGEIDMQDRHIATNANKAVFFDNMQKGGYEFFETVPASMNEMIIALNLTHKDPVKRQIFQSQAFRIGLSYAINRQEIIDVVWVGQGEPFQAAPRPSSELYNEQLAKQYTEYSPQKAQEYLDKAFPKKDSEGYRVGPDGQRISFTVEVTAATGAERVDALNLVQKYWKAVGVDMHVKEEDRALLYTRKRANEHDAVVWGGDGGLDVILEPRWYFPFSDESNFAIGWAIYFNPAGNPGTAPEEPPPAAKQQMELYRQIQRTGDQSKQEALMKQILQIAAEQFWVIGTVLPTNGYGLVKRNMQNVPQQMPGAWLYPTPAPTNTMQYFFDK